VLRNKLKLYEPHNISFRKELNAIEEDCCSFNGNRKVTRDGIPQLNVGGVKLKEFIERYFFPPIPPVLTLVIEGKILREVGDYGNVSLDWSVTKKTLGIVHILIDTVDLAPAYPDATIKQDSSVFGTSNADTFISPVQLPDNTFSLAFYLYARDTLNNQFSVSASLNFLFRRFWFVTDQSVMTLNEDDLSALILGELATSELSTNRQQEKTLTCDNQYICFAWPVAFGGDNTNFLVDTRIMDAWQSRDFNYTNAFGFTSSYRVICSWYKLYGQYAVISNQ
jgi:hypothetical protein